MHIKIALLTAMPVERSVLYDWYHINHCIEMYSVVFIIVLSESV